MAQVGKQITFKLEGIFDRRAATQLRLALETVVADDVLLDFSRVSQLPDLSLHVLVGDLATRGLHARGLASHQERVFRYLGVPSEPRAADAETEAA